VSASLKLLDNSK